MSLEHGIPSDSLEQGMSTDYQEARKVIVFVGVTGAGKSSACNLLAGGDFSTASSGFESATQDTQHASVVLDDVRLRIIDTVGFLDNRMSEKEKRAKFGQFADRASFGVDVFMLTFRDGRFTDQDERSFKLFVEVAGKEALQHTVLAFTHITDVDLQKKLSSPELPQSLREILAKVGGRAIGMENRYAQAEAINCAHKAIRDVLSLNNGKRYSNKALLEAQKRREAVERRISKMTSADRKSALMQLYQGLMNGSQKYEAILSSVLEAEQEEQREVAQREQERRESERLVAAERQRAETAEQTGRFRTKQCKLVLSALCLTVIAAAVVICLFVFGVFENHAGRDFCGKAKCLPGVDKLGFGFDVMTGQIPEKGSPIVKFTFKEQKKHQNDKNPSLLYDVPDQLQVLKNVHFQETVSTTVSYSASQFGQKLSSGVSFSASQEFNGSMFSISDGVKTANSFLQNRKSYSAYTHSTIFGTLYQASILPKYEHELEEAWLDAVEQLPEKYNYPAYKDFIIMYGTHYLSGAYFGGYGQMSVAVNSNYAQTQTSAWMSQQAAIQYKWFQAGENGTQSDSNFRGQGSDTSSISTELVGGEPSLVGESLSKWQKWVESWYNGPALVYNEDFPVFVSELHTLMPNGTKQENLKRAIMQYAAENPYPPDPDCMEGVLSPQGTCCTRENPISCGDTCYPSGTTCCGSEACNNQQQCCNENECIDLQAECCSYPPPAPSSCPYGQECTACSWCLGAGYVCCEPDQDAACDPQHPLCCTGSCSKYCCPSGHSCVDLPIIGCGCNPLDKADPNSTVPAVPAQRPPHSAKKDSLVQFA